MDEERLRKALIAATEALGDGASGNGSAGTSGHEGRDGQDGREPLTCAPRALPDRLTVAAARTAYRVNPMNGPVLTGAMSAVGTGAGIGQPLRIAMVTSKYWRPVPRTLTVSFLEPTPPEVRTRILSHMNAWSTRGCITFTDTATGGEVRISREADGYWSYLGTDILHIPPDRPTMNLQDFSMSTPESEYKRVVRHETGHTLGFPHEHMRRELVARIDPQKAYPYFLETQGWPKDMVDAQVLTPLDDSTLVVGRIDQYSIMCYQLPGEITVDGQPIVGGVDIDASDYEFVAKVYPQPSSPSSAPLPSPRATVEADWPESEDILEPATF